jgi:hypothetical protein
MSFLKDFFFLNLNDFENIGLNFPIGIFLIMLAVAICGMVFIINWHKTYTIAMLKQLLRHEATSEASAKTLADLGLSNTWGLKSSLSKSGQLTYVVKRVGEEKLTYEKYMENQKKKKSKEKNEKIDFTSSKFYIESGKLDRAKRLVETDNASWWKPVFISLIIIAVLILSALFLSDILQAINSSLAS